MWEGWVTMYEEFRMWAGLDECGRSWEFGRSWVKGWEKLKVLEELGEGIGGAEQQLSFSFVFAFSFGAVFGLAKI